MNFIKFTNELKNKDNKALVEAIQSGYNALHEASEEKVYSREDGSTHARVFMHDLKEVNWDELELKARQLDEVDGYTSTELADIFDQFIGPRNQYAGSADWGGADVWSFKQGDSEYPGFEGLFLGSFDHAWVVGNRTLDEDQVGYDYMSTEIELDEQPSVIVSAIRLALENL